MAAHRAKQQRPPSKRLQIIRQWEPLLVDMGKVDPGELELHHQGSRGLCFACGFEERLDQAHIHPRVRGGSDEPNNLHLLCVHCHQQSEYLEGARYWQWFREQGQWARLLQRVSASCPSAFAKALSSVGS